jgi:hypothetical protein
MTVLDTRIVVSNFGGPCEASCPSRPLASCIRCVCNKMQYAINATRRRGVPPAIIDQAIGAINAGGLLPPAAGSR